MSTLKGKTIFITGGSRGIGLAIGLRAARDGANIIVAAKTAEPHPSLPGTIHTAAKEIEKAGGNALPVQLDIRDEAQIEAAVEKAADHFGGIDCLVNNASALSLTKSMKTTVKRYDLMMDCNVRGSFVTTQACIQHLKNAKNPHVLMISPPLNINPKWFGRHCIYTISKYGMSMLVVGLSQELKRSGIAVNALWPRTVVLTSSLMHSPNAEEKYARKPEIMADSAYEVLTSKAAENTGNFYIDEDILRHAGVTDFNQYAVSSGQALLSDLFLD